MSSACFTPHVLVVVVEVGSLHVFSLFYTTCLSGCGRGWIATCLQPVLYHMSQWLRQRLDRYMSSVCFTPHVLVVVVEVGSLHVFSLFYTTCLSGCGRGWIATCLQPVLYHMSQWLRQRLDRYMSSGCFIPHVLVVEVEVGSLHVFSLFYTTCLSGCGRGWIATCLQPVLHHMSQWLWQRLDRYMSSACFTPHVLVVVVEVGSLHVFSLFYTTCLSGCGRGWIATCLQPVLHHMSQWLWQRLDRYMSSACFTPHVLVVVVEVGSLHVFSLFYTTCLSGCGRGWIATCLQPVLHHMSQWLWQRLDRYMSSACFIPHVLVVVVEVGSLHVFSLFYTTCLSGCGRGWIATCLQPVLYHMSQWLWQRLDRYMSSACFTPHVLVVVVEVGSLHVFSLFYTTCLSGCGRGWIATCLQPVLYHMSQWLWQRLDRYMSSACFIPHVLVVVVEVGSLHVFSLFYTTCLSGCGRGWIATCLQPVLHHMSQWLWQRLDRYMSSACFIPHVLVVVVEVGSLHVFSLFYTTCLSGCGRGWIATCLQPVLYHMSQWLWQRLDRYMSSACFIPHVLVVVVEVGSLHVFSLFYTTCLSGCGRGWIATCLQPVLHHMSQWLWQRLDRYMSSACFTPHVLVVVVEVGSLHVFSLFYTTCLSGCGRGWIATCLQPVLHHMSQWLWQRLDRYMSSACFIPHVLVVVVEVGSLHVFSLFYTTCLSGCGRGWIATCLQPVLYHMSQWLWQRLDRYMSSACFIPHVLVVVVEVGSLHVFSLFYTTCLSGCGRGWIATCLQPVLYHMSQWLWQRLDRYMSSACFTPHVLVVVVEVGSLHVSCCVRLKTCFIPHVMQRSNLYHNH